MTLHKRILLGILFIAFCLVGLIFINAQLILADGYQQLEAQVATQNVERVIQSLHSDIDRLHFSDINFSLPSKIRLPSEATDSRLVQEQFSAHLKTDVPLNFVLLLDAENNIILQNAATSNDGIRSSIPKSLLTFLKPGSPLLDASIKGIMALPEGLLMTVSVPVFAADTPNSSGGRLISGRFIDADEIDHLEQNTQLDIQLFNFNNSNITSDILRAKSKLGGANHYYVEPVNDQLLSTYTTIDDIYGKPTILIRAQMPRTIYRIGQDSIGSFFVSTSIVVALLGIVVFLLFERTIISRLSALNLGLARAKATDYARLEILPTGTDEISLLTSGIRDVIKVHAQTTTQLRDAKETLERRVSERSADLTRENKRLEQELADRKQGNQLLTQARDKALGELHLKSQMLANVSHDSRTPLTIIGLNIEMLQQGRYGHLDDKQLAVLSRISTATRQLLSFITNMLDEAQLKNGKMSIVNILYEPKELIEDFVRLLEPLAESKGIELKSDIDLTLPHQLKGDPSRLKQVLSNLAENAIKFTDTGSVVIRAQRKDETHWSITVTDTGRGIPAEAQSRIFEAYWQLRSTAQGDSNRGVGLGLSIVKQIVQLMGGTIAVTSKVGEGTSFVMTLPIEEVGVTDLVRQISV